MQILPTTRKSFTGLGEIYFWTATIHQWLPLLEPDENKQLIIDYLKKLADAKLITVCLCDYAQSYSFNMAAKSIQWERNTQG